MAVAPNARRGGHGPPATMASAGQSCSRSRPETLSTPAPLEGSGPWAPSVALGLGFLPPQLSAPESVVLGQLSSVHPPAAVVEAEEVWGLPCGEMKAVPADRRQRRWGFSREAGREPLPKAGAAQNRCLQLRGKSPDESL